MAKKEKASKTITVGLDETLKEIHKKLGKDSIIRMGDNWSAAGLDVIPSGAICLDSALGIGGYPKSRIIEILGPESSGKTTLALQAIANAQEKGGVAAFVDAENAFDPVYSSGIGVNVDDLLVSQPNCGEEGLDIVEMLVRSGEVDIIVVDSVAALVPKDELEGEMGKSHMGLQARLMSQACRKLSGIVSKTKTCLIFINQIRQKIGVQFGNPETTPGGNALKFYSSVRVDVRRIGSVKDKAEKITGNRVRARIVKNKVAPPFRTAEFTILFGIGIDQIHDLLECGVQCGVIDRSGTWFSYKKERLGQGVDNCRERLVEPDLFNEIKNEVVKKWL